MAAPPTTAEPPPHTSLALATLAGISLDLARPAARFTLLAEWGFREPWGATLELDAETPRTVSLGPGTITLQSYALGLSARRRLIAGLSASLGAHVFLFPVSTTGFTTNGSPLLVSAAFTAALDWRQTLYRRLYLAVRVAGQARIQAEVIAVPGVEGALILPVWTFVAQTGLGLTLD